MNIIVTGASGFVGRQLVPLLHARGHTLLLVGRDAEHMKATYPDLPTCSYDDLPRRARGYDALLHLAARNNDQGGDESDFAAANAILPVKLAKIAREAGILRFLHASTVHAQIKPRGSLYAWSKRQGERALDELEGIFVTHLRFGAVHGSELAGNFAVVGKLPSFLRPIAHSALGSLKPTTAVGRIREAIEAVLATPSNADGLTSEYKIVTDDKLRNRFYCSFTALLNWGFALSVLVLFWWLLLLVFVLVRLGSSGPGIFVQDRVGKDRVVFSCLKFRTMKRGTVQAGTHEISSDSVTAIGRFLRRTKLDELPQALNILRGEMSLVGPRACLPSQTILIEERLRRGIYRTKPGISGLAQVEGIDMSDPIRLSIKDREYMDLRCIFLDLSIIIATFLGRGAGDRVTA